MKSLALLLLAGLAATAAARDPNVVIIFTDDQGYNDLGCFGSARIRTPQIDRLAAEGLKLTDFHVPSPVCSPSRAGLLTGCYPKRVGMHRHVVFPADRYGLHPDEITLADHLKKHGYATACIGKWHLGHQPEVLPTAQGFDRYFGIPYSNDMSHPDNRRKPGLTMDKVWNDPAGTVGGWNTPLMRDTEIIELPVDQRTITRRYTDEAIRFVEENRARPFFLYLPHSMPHIPLYLPEDAHDPDPQNAYKAVIEHIDTETGRLIAKLRELGLEKDTLVIYTTDNGPWLQFKHHGGSAAPLRDGKGTPFEGGVRVPCIVWGPGRIPAGKTSDELLSTIDLLPTLATLSGHPLAEGKPIDGLDASATLLKGEKSPRREFLHYTSQGALAGIRQDDWKLLVMGGGKEQPPAPMLFNLAKDVGESDNLAAAHPERVAAMRARMTELDGEITRQARPIWGTKK